LGIKSFRLIQGIFRTAGSIDQVVGPSDFFLLGKLRPDSRQSLPAPDAVSRHQPADLFDFGAENDDDAVEKIGPPGFEEKGGFGNINAGPTFVPQAGHLSRHTGQDTGMDEFFDPGPPTGVMEDDPAESGAVDGAVRPQDAGAESLDQGVIDGTSPPHEIAGGPVGRADETSRLRGQDGGDQGLPTGDAARQADGEHAIGFLRF